LMASSLGLYEKVLSTVRLFPVPGSPTVSLSL